MVIGGRWPFHYLGETGILWLGPRLLSGRPTVIIEYRGGVETVVRGRSQGEESENK